MELILLVLVILGLLWAANSFITMDPKAKNIMNVIVIGLLLIWVLTGLFGYGPYFHFGR